MQCSDMCKLSNVIVALDLLAAFDTISLLDRLPDEIVIEGVGLS